MVPRLLESALPWPLVIKLTDINTDPICHRITDQDMALCCNSSPDVIMALGSSAGHSVLLYAYYPETGSNIVYVNG